MNLRLTFTGALAKREVWSSKKLTGHYYSDSESDCAIEPGWKSAVHY